MSRPHPRPPLMHHRADLRLLGFMGLYAALLGTQWAGWQWIGPAGGWPVAVALWWFTGFLCFVGAVATHNLIHTPVFRPAWLNDTLRVLTTLWYGQPVSLFVPVHNLSHHRYAQSRRDITRTTKVDHRLNLLNLWHGVGWQRSAFRLCKRFFQDHRARQSRIWRQFRRELVVLLVYLVALAALSPVKMVVLVLLPHKLGQFGIKAINFLQHDGCDPDLSSPNHSRNFVGPVFNWWLMNNGYHTIHHLRPTAHWSTLPALHAQRVAPTIHPALDQPNALTYLWRTFLWPGERLTFDGRPYRPDPEDAVDLPWYGDDDTHADDPDTVAA